jgi:hypothetical protein
MMIRPASFRIDAGHRLAKGLVYAALGHPLGSSHYHDASLYQLTPAGLSVPVPTFDFTLGRCVVDFNGSSHYVELPVNTQTSPRRDFTVAFWARPDTLAVDGRAISLWGSASHQVLIVWMDADGTADGWSAILVSDVIGTDSASATVDVWQHVCFRRQGSAIDILVDGVQTASGSDSQGYIGETADNAYIGRSSSEYFNGELADLMMWHRALADSEVCELAEPSNCMLSGLIEEDEPAIPVSLFSGGGATAYTNYYQQQLSVVANA